MVSVLREWETWESCRWWKVGVTSHVETPLLCMLRREHRNQNYIKAKDADRYDIGPRYVCLFYWPEILKTWLFESEKIEMLVVSTF